MWGWGPPEGWKGSGILACVQDIRTQGLTAADVAERVARGQVNTLPPRSGRTVGQIVRDNVFTRINAILAVLLVVAGLHLAGEQLHLLHLIGMLLIVAVGSNYVLFFDQSGGTAALDDATLVSMAVANLTTAIGFGTLALSNVPVLHAVGATVGPGAVLALLLAAVFVGRTPRSEISQGSRRI